MQTARMRAAALLPYAWCAPAIATGQYRTLVCDGGPSHAAATCNRATLLGTGTLSGPIAGPGWRHQPH